MGAESCDDGVSFGAEDAVGRAAHAEVGEVAASVGEDHLVGGLHMGVGAANGGDAPVELLRYNALAGAKYATFGMSYPLSDRTNRDEDFTVFFANATMS